MSFSAAYPRNRMRRLRASPWIRDMVEEHSVRPQDLIWPVFILYNIGEDEMTVGELTIRGYYLGSNVSYNVKKMVENGYLIQERSVHDKRSIRVRLSDKGSALRTVISDMFRRHEGMIEGTEITDGCLATLNDTLKMLERFWAQQTNFSGGF